MLGAVIFDFDGVISDSERLHHKAAQDIFAGLGVDLTWERYFHDYIVYTDAECFEAVSRDFGLSLDSRKIADLINQKGNIFRRIAEIQNTIYEGVTELVELLKAGNIRMAICSGASLNDIETILAGTSLIGAFEVIVSADDVSRGKPEPEGYLLALKRLNDNGSNLSGNHCVVIEDTIGGIKAAKAAGMKCLAVANTYDANELEAHADMVVAGLGQLSIASLEGIL
ncbi:MAG: HAD family phosphatase [Anaerohalosphaera sp.]|nr:HAD family phosphatase [Anaerohalosphaera sp.]